MIKIEQLYKYYQNGSVLKSVLNGINVHLEKGDLVALMGQSSAGKSTLLNIIGIFDNYDSGNYYLNGVHIQKYDHPTSL